MVDLMAGIAVRDYEAALAWYERFFGSPPTYVVSDTEALWEVTEHGAVYVEQRPERATGHAMHTLFVGDLDERIAAISARGIEPADVETYDNGVRKFVFHDPEGNEFGIGGGPG
ncbi:VOC family protein [Amycolatopsis sp. NPDC098790]|uniref:VOC family protein n=1 Tax=Amycolatopsis sp. NPDC098790 TaxID=3363939 RepID=UPI0038238A1F